MAPPPGTHGGGRSVSGGRSSRAGSRRGAPAEEAREFTNPSYRVGGGGGGGGGGTTVYPRLSGSASVSGHRSALSDVYRTSGGRGEPQARSGGGSRGGAAGELPVVQVRMQFPSKAGIAEF